MSASAAARVRRERSAGGTDPAIGRGGAGGPGEPLSGRGAGAGVTVPGGGGRLRASG